MKTQKRKYRNLNVTISSVLVEFLLASGWKQSSLAKKLNINQSLISRLAKKERTISFNLFVKLLQLLDDEQCFDFVNKLRS